MPKKEINLKISGMHCPSCEKIVAMELEELPGAQNIVVDSKNGSATLKVQDDLDNKEVIEAVSRAGYQAQVLEG